LVFEGFNLSENFFFITNFTSFLWLFMMYRGLVVNILARGIVLSLVLDF